MPSPRTPRYRVDPVPEFLEGNAERFTADGLPLPEIRRAASEVGAWGSWWPYWMERSRWFDTCAGEPRHSRHTRVHLLVLSMLSAHLAQYLHFHDADEKHEALQRKIHVFQQAASLLAPPARLVEIPFRRDSLPGIFRVPAGAAGPVGCVVYVGGLDAHKEDAHSFAELCLERGTAVLAFDGPGQGEALLRDIYLEEDAHTAVSAAISAVAGFEEVDANRIGLIGRSLGGYLAPRAAAEHTRVRALAVWGAMYDLANFEELPTHTREGFRFITAARSEEQAADRLRFIDMSGVAERIGCPTLIVHGGRDTLTPPANARRLAHDIGQRCRLELFENSPHCNHDLAHVVRPLLADWLASQLG